MVHALQVVATAYGVGCGGGFRTATGMGVRPGIIAVDPNIIPLHSHLSSRWGPMVAEDTGGDIMGNRIDIWMSSCQAAREWGVRRITIYFSPKNVHTIKRKVCTSVYPQVMIENRDAPCLVDDLSAGHWMDALCQRAWVYTGTSTTQRIRIQDLLQSTNKCLEPKIGKSMKRQHVE